MARRSYKDIIFKVLRHLLGLREPVTRTRVWRLYALECEDGCYYVGITSYRSVWNRYEQHATGKGSNWTRLHPPRRLLWTRKLGYMTEAEAVLIETMTTVQFINMYGLHSVRGGILVAVDPVLHELRYQRFVKNRAVQTAHVRL